jgi:transcription antitermination factor NusG
MKRWYVLHTHPKDEIKVATTLQQQWGLEVYFPQTQGVKSKPFFTSYLFIRVDFFNETALSKMQWVPGLRRIVSFDEWPVPVPDAVIELIKEKLADNKKLESKHNFNPGDTIRIKSGPFQDFLGIFEETTSSNERVQILLKVLGVTRVQVEVSEVEKVSLADDPQPPPTKRVRRTRGKGRRIRSVVASS